MMSKLNEDEIICNLRHCRQCGYCIPSIIKYCKHCNFDWKKFKRGVKVSELKKYNLTEFNKVIASAKLEERRKNGI